VPQRRRRKRVGASTTAEIEVADAPNRGVGGGLSIRLHHGWAPGQDRLVFAASDTVLSWPEESGPSPPKVAPGWADYVHGTDNVAGKPVNDVGSQSAKWPAVRRGMAVVVAVDVAVAAYAPIATDVFRWYYWLQVGAAVIAVTTFLGVWLTERNTTSGAQRDPMRDAIAAAFVVTYLVSVSWAVFLFVGPNVNPQMTQLQLTLVQNFTVLTGVVVGAHFSADALKQVAHIRAQGRGPSAERGNDDSAQ